LNWHKSCNLLNNTQQGGEGMYQKYVVKLNETERYQLKQLISFGTTPARKLRRAHILLKSDSSEAGPNWTYQAIMEAYDVSNVTITNTRRNYVEGGLEAALQRKKPQRDYTRCLDGEAEAHLIALACGKAPEGYERWSLRLLTKRSVQLGIAEQLSYETVRRTLKKMNLSLG
jgi:transposase